MSPHTFSRRRIIAAGAAAAAASALVSLTSPASAQTGTIRNDGAPGSIAGSYIVVFDNAKVAKGKVAATASALAGQHHADVRLRYSTALRGFAATMARAEALKLAADPSVAYVEQDRTISIAGTQSPTPSWGLDRIDQRSLPLNNSYTYPNTASNVTAYIIDTGIRTTHADFGGRAVWGTNTTGDGQNTDCNGHGTHVAGTVGGASAGVAKSVKLVAVKVLDCTGSGSFSGVAAGIDWVTANHLAGQPAVANMSLGAQGSDSATETAVRNAIADGVTFAIASGNSNADACNYTPARVSQAITVNASTTTDARASFSNYGSCTDIFAPGQSIVSDWNTSDTATNTLSGTSMATPHVTGAAALILGANPSYTPAQVASVMTTNATTGKITNAGTGSPNRLLYVGAGGVAPSDCAAQTNGTDTSIPDNSTTGASSTITISGCTGNASASSTIEVHIVHTYRGDLVVDLITPTGAVVNLANRSGGSADNIDATYLKDLSAYPANGTWTLRVRDLAAQDVGYINSWTLDV